LWRLNRNENNLENLCRVDSSALKKVKQLDDCFISQDEEMDIRPWSYVDERWMKRIEKCEPLGGLGGEARPDAYFFRCAH
jgi:hypothetical protein